MEITREQFVAYERIRVAGFTNMFAIGTVSDCSGLDREVVLAVQDQYAELRDKYPLTDEETANAEALGRALRS